MGVKVTKSERKRIASSFTGGRMLKRSAETEMVTNAPIEVEDEFQNFYETSSSNGNRVVIEPPFNPVQLIAICTRNNTLQQCIHAMEVNVDGTDHTIEPVDEGTDNASVEGAALKPAAGSVSKAAPFPPPASGVAPKDMTSVQEDNDPEKQKAEDFFKEPYPGTSMITLRRKVRVDLEQTGNAYIEAVRNITGELLMLRYAPAFTMRLLRLDDPVEVERTITRDGKELKVKMPVRERRFAQRIGAHLTFYKEFGSERSLNRKTGAWVAPGTLKAEDEASEILWFTVDRDAGTPYGLPRWINNLPSALGSRKAEEFNLEFFDAGGVPPALVIVAGGSMTTSVKDQLLQHLSGRNKAKHRAAVVEVQSASGTMDAAGKVDVKVERFGDARQNDSMFQNYDEKCEGHIRLAFRLPPLFLGSAGDYNFATAVTAYMVAEAQVFAPERAEFDDIINATVMKALGIKKYKFVSKPITLKNADVMLKAVEAAKPVLDGAEHVDQLNQIAGLSMKHSPLAEQASRASTLGPDFHPDGTPRATPDGKPLPYKGVPLQSKTNGGASEKPNTRTRAMPAKKWDITANDIVTLVSKWAIASGLEEGEMSADERSAVLDVVGDLDGDTLDLFNKILAAKSFVRTGLDPDGLGDIAGCAHHMTRKGTKKVADVAPPTIIVDNSAVQKAVADMAKVVKDSSERSIEVVRELLKKEERPITLNLELKLPDRKPVKKTATYSDGRKVTLTSE